MYELNDTHDPRRTSWVDTANRGHDFPIQNLPFAAFRRKRTNEAFRIGVAIGDQILDLAAVKTRQLFSGEAGEAIDVCDQTTMNALMAFGRQHWVALRAALSRALTEGSSLSSKLADCLVSQDISEYAVPARIGDYTDFYTSIHHATNVGRLFRPDNPLLPNYRWIPIGYHGRSSTIEVSGQTFHRPKGQIKKPDMDEPYFGPCERLDYELEVGIFIGPGNDMGRPITMSEAEDQVFGICLFNDWSARDIQAWEYQPLGPFLSKNFASAVSPWVVTSEALAPYRTEWRRSPDDPQPLPYLDSESNVKRGAIDIQLEVLIETAAMRDRKQGAARLSLSSFRHSYWTVAQMIVHHTVNGCSLSPGDFFGSGTQSGPDPSEAGSLLELTAGGKQAVRLDNGETRTFVEDGDAIVLRGWCERPGAARIGFGEVVSRVLPAAD